MLVPVPTDRGYNLAVAQEATTVILAQYFLSPADRDHEDIVLAFHTAGSPDPQQGSDSNKGKSPEPERVATRACIQMLPRDSDELRDN